jgi:hypothetical protein
MQFAFQLNVDWEAARTMALDKLWQHLFGVLLDRPITAGGKLIRESREKLAQTMTREEFIQDPEFVNAFLNEDSIQCVKECFEQSNATIFRLFQNDKIL